MEKSLREILNDNHLEVCQRLTRLETQFEGVPDRVSKLESNASEWRGAKGIVNMLVTMAVSAFVALAAAFIRKGH